jgi:hypothetical protein
MKRKLNIISMVLAVTMLAFLPATAAMAQGTTVEVNSGETIQLEPGETITASGTGGIAVEIKNLPDLGAPDNGLAAFDFDFNWDPDVIQVDSVVYSPEAMLPPPLGAGWWIISGYINNTTGTVSVVGINTNYSTDDVLIMYFGITATGDNGDSTSISVTINNLFDSNNNEISATSVNAPVVIQAEESYSVNWLPPLTTQEVYTAQTGSTIPVKFQVLDTQGNPVAGEEVMVTVTRNSDTMVVFSGQAVYKPDCAAYQVNIKTTGWENGEYTITVSASEEASYGLDLVDKAKGKAKQKGK